MWTQCLFWNRNGGLYSIMANPNDIFSQLASGSTGSLSSTVDQLAGASVSEGVRGLGTQLEQLRALFQAQTVSTQENTEALTRATNNTGGGVTAALGDAARTAGSALSGGFFLSPLLSGVLKLFGRDSTPEPPPLATFALPRSVAIDGSIQAAGASTITATQYAQDGLPRVAAPAARVPQVTVQVSAMDARSFLDRSDDIARAVKEAMLNSHSVNDVIGEL